MKETINYEIPDLYLEHSQHNTYEPQCSECYKFALSIPVGERAFLLVDMKTIDDTLRPPLTREDEEQMSLLNEDDIAELTLDKRIEEAESAQRDEADLDSRERDESNGEL